MYDSPIPHAPFPSGHTEFTALDEPLVEVTAFPFVPKYAQQSLPGAIDRCYLRQGVYDRLIQAGTYLPSGYTFLIYDAWRPFSVQQALYDRYRQQLVRLYPHRPDREIDLMTSQFVSPPIHTPLDSPAHSTGGSVDLTLLDPSGHELDMGTEFDSFSISAHTAYFEDSTTATHVRDNRRMLYHAMTRAGFTNLPTEWWHFDYGNRFWSFYCHTPALYQGIFE